MILNNIKNNQKKSGFTIVELLVVIVVIGILAAITIVSYTGITAKASTAKNQANAQSTQNVAEAMNADNGFYPALAVGAAASYGLTGGSDTTRLPAGVTPVPDAATEVITATTAKGDTTKNNVSYSCLTTCTSSTGGRIGYWDFSANSIKYIYVGSATAAGPWAYPAS